MAYQLSKNAAQQMFRQWTDNYLVVAPRLMEGEGCFSDTDIVRYGPVTSLDEIEWTQKSDYSFKEALLPINEILFYYTEEDTSIPKLSERETLIFLRACDLNAVKRLDQIYLDNGFGDFYYARRRDKVKFVLMECAESCASGFCVSMGTNTAEDYDACIRLDGDTAYVDLKWAELEKYIDGAESLAWSPEFVQENNEKVTLPKKLSNETFTKEIWEEYGSRCIGCGRCNFVCPTCTCFTMQDVFYRDNAKVGERRRVWASCQVDGYTDIAGGASFRKKQGERMRFKVMHKVYDFEKRFGYPMCVGCGRCDDVCPEYISYSNCLNRLAKEEE